MAKSPCVIGYILTSFMVLLPCAVPVRAQTPPPPSSSDDLFAKSSWHLELGVHAAFEAWNYNISHEQMLAGTAGVSYSLTPTLALVMSAPVYYVRQRGPDAGLFGGTCGLRWRTATRHRFAVFIEGEFGISRADVPTPPLGTQFNYLVLGAGGVAMPLSRRTHLLAGIKWVHVSNNKLAGRGRNPDIQALGPRISILRELWRADK